MAYQGIAQDVAAVMTAFRVSGLLDSVCNIQAPDGLTAPSGAPSGTYVAVAGLQNIACMDAPENTGSGFSVNETRQLPEIESESFRHVLLDKYYPLLSPATNWGNVGWRAVVDGNVYDLMGAENDSQFTQTRIRLRAVTI